MFIIGNIFDVTSGQDHIKRYERKQIVSEKCQTVGEGLPEERWRIIDGREMILVNETGYVSREKDVPECKVRGEVCNGKCKLVSMRNDCFLI